MANENRSGEDRRAGMSNVEISETGTHKRLLLTEAQAARVEHLELAIEAALEKFTPDQFHAEAGRLLRAALKNE